MVQNPVQCRRGIDAVPVHLAPGAEVLVGAGLINGKIVDLINDQKSGHGIGLESFLQLALGQSFGEVAQ